MAKLAKPITLYMGPELLGPRGANCGTCMMYLKDTSECSILKPAGVKSDGVCGLYVQGKHPAGGEAMEIVPKAVAGYIDDGPTRCGLCRYAQAQATRCAVVEGAIHPYGCCNHFEAKESDGFRRLG